MLHSQLFTLSNLLHQERLLLIQIRYLICLLDDQLCLLFIDIELLLVSSIRGIKLLLHGFVLQAHIVTNLGLSQQDEDLLAQVLDLSILVIEGMALTGSDQRVIRVDRSFLLLLVDLILVCRRFLGGGRLTGGFRALGLVVFWHR